MEYFNKIICVTYDELVNRRDGEPVIKINTLDSLLRRKPYLRVQRGGGLESYALIDYSALPERYRIRFEQKYGDPVELIKEKCMKNRLKIDEAARIFFEDYRYDKAGELVSLT
ncbi:MAG: kinase, partial [Butyricimonas faecalis]